jgi:hypothetical protein
VSDSGSDKREWVREAMTMALYISLSLLAVLVALPTTHIAPSGTRAAVTVVATAVGLVLAHYVAFRLSSRLVDQGLITGESLELLGAQLSGALPVAIAAAIPPLVLGGTSGRLVSELLLVAFVAGVGYRAARQSAGPGRSILYVGGVLVAVGVVVAVKTAVGH